MIKLPLFRKIAFVGLIVFGTASILGAKQENELSKETRRIMKAIYISMQELLPLSFNEESFRAKENQEKIKGFLKSLANNGKALSTHGVKREQGFRYMSRTFESDVKQTYLWYQQGDTEGARFYLHNIIDDCVECHSKLPTKKEYLGAKALFKDVAISNLTALEKARLQVAMRQFNNALTTYENHFTTLIKRVLIRNGCLR